MLKTLVSAAILACSLGLLAPTLAQAQPGWHDGHHYGWRHGHYGWARGHHYGWGHGHHYGWRHHHHW